MVLLWRWLGSALHFPTLMPDAPPLIKDLTSQYAPIILITITIYQILFQSKLYCRTISAPIPVLVQGLAFYHSTRAVHLPLSLRTKKQIQHLNNTDGMQNVYVWRNACAEMASRNTISSPSHEHNPGKLRIIHPNQIEHFQPVLLCGLAICTFPSYGVIYAC